VCPCVDKQSVHLQWNIVWVHRPDAAAVEQFFDAIPHPAARTKIASGNAEVLFRLA